MTFTRDSVTWWIGIVGSLVGIILAQADALGLSPHWKVILTIILSFVGVITAKLGSSPLSVSPDGYVKEVKDHREEVQKAKDEGKILLSPPPIPPIIEAPKPQG